FPSFHAVLRLSREIDAGRVDAPASPEGGAGGEVVRGPCQTASAGPVPANSTGGVSGARCVDRKTILRLPSFSGSGSVSTTIVWPAPNSFQRIFSDTGSSRRRWIARRSGRAPREGS